MMDEMTVYRTYDQLKQAFDQEIRRQADGFVRMGYLLKVARDTDILAESKYRTIAEFARGEYGLTDDTVSRMIKINDRYSEGGYSECLADRYRGFGQTLLAEMLVLSDVVVESIPPEITRAQLREVKEEIKEEAAITDLEVMMEDTDPHQEKIESVLVKALYQYYKENYKEYPELHKAVTGAGVTPESVMELLAPSGTGVKMVRIPGMGRYMITIRGKNQNIRVVNIRTNDLDEFTWSECILALGELCKGTGSAEEDWEKCYGELYPGKKKAEVVPAQKAEEKPKAQKTEQCDPKQTKNESKTERCEPEQTKNEPKPEQEEEWEENGDLPDPEDAKVEKPEDSGTTTTEAPEEPGGQQEPSSESDMDNQIESLKEDAMEAIEEMKKALERNYIATVRRKAKEVIDLMTEIGKELDRKPMKGQYEMVDLYVGVKVEGENE